MSDVKMVLIVRVNEDGTSDERLCQMTTQLDRQAMVKTMYWALNTGVKVAMHPCSQPEDKEPPLENKLDTGVEGETIRLVVGSKEYPLPKG